MRWSKNKTLVKWLVLAVSVCILPIIFVVGVLVGPVDISIGEVFRVIFGGGADSANYNIIMYVRLPRVLASMMAGAGLAGAGGVLQSVLNNNLASTGIIGINAGAGLFAISALAIFPTSILAMPLGAFFGALVSAVAVWLLAARTGASKSTIILAGVGVSSLFTAITDAIILLIPDLQVDRFDFNMGGFSGANYDSLAMALPFFLVGLVGCLLLSYDLNVLSLGDELAGGLGMRTRIVRLLAILCVALLAGSCISIAGLLGFVGLVVPNAVAKIIGKDNVFLLPTSAVVGAWFTMICDLVARTAFAPYELPVGIILSLVGVPFFLFLIFCRKRRRV